MRKKIIDFSKFVQQKKKNSKIFSAKETNFEIS